MDIDNNSTKALIFDTSIELFAQYGYEQVSIRSISERVGIQSASIYHHFANKDSILAAIYQYYQNLLMTTFQPVSLIKQVIRSGTKEEIVACFFPTIATLEPHIFKRMSLATKIVYMRMFQDEVARRIYREIDDRARKVCREISEYGISIGRFEPFDVEAFTVFVTQQRVIMGINAFLDPDYTVRELQEEKIIIQLAMQLLPLRQDYHHRLQNMEGRVRRA